jgi:predicted P-loop ATPase
MTSTKSSLIDTLIDGLKVLPDTFCLTPVNGNKEAYLTGWTKEGFPPDSPLLIKEIKSRKAKGYGITTGKLSAGIVAVDCDGKAAHDLAEKLGGLPHTVSFTSGIEGRAQYLYQVSQEFRDSITTKKINTGEIGSNGKEVLLELRWNGCQSVLPPSVHPETGSYKWINSIENTAIAQAPIWVIEKMLVTSKTANLTPIEKNLQEPVPPSFYDEIPLYNCLSLNERGLIDFGATDGNRNNSAKKLVLALLGAEDYLKNSDIRFRGTARQLYDDFCDRCNPSLSSKERDNIWKFGLGADSPKQSLPPDAIKNCIEAWQKCSNGNGNEQKFFPHIVNDNSNDNSNSAEPELKKTPALIKAFEKAKQIIGNRIRLNLMNHNIELDGEELDLEYLELELALTLGLEIKIGGRRIGSNQLEAIVFKIAKINAYNPIQVYLEECHQKHPDTKILDGIAQRYFGVSDEIYQTYFKKFLVAAVARIYDPGCQQENTLILQSNLQGLFKSSFFKILSGDTYFCDDMGDFKEKDERLKVHQNWIIEWGEFERVTTKKGAGAIKNFLSTREDQIRPPYARKNIKMKRQSVIVGTANPKELLYDNTGSRRYWVIPVAQSIPLNLLREERDAIWGAAVSLYKAGEKWWLNSDEQQQSESANENFQAGNFLQQEIEDYMVNKTQVSTAELLTAVEQLGFKVDNPQTLKIVELQIKAAVTHLKWEPCRLSIDGKRPRGYRSPITPSQENDTPEKNDIPNNSESTQSALVDETFEQLDKNLINFITTDIKVELTAQQKDALTLFESVLGWRSREPFKRGWENLNYRGQRHFIEILMIHHPDRLKVGDRIRAVWHIDLNQIRKRENYLAVPGVKS